jgi:hypothetical protein
VGCRPVARMVLLLRLLPLLLPEAQSGLHVQHT